MVVENERSLTGLRERAESMEARTEGVAVAVRQIMGTEGHAMRK